MKNRNSHRSALVAALAIIAGWVGYMGSAPHGLITLANE
jgi:hypothetical protein